MTGLDGSYPEFRVLYDLLKISGRTIATVFRMGICAIGVAMLISFPTARTNHFRQHFGTTQIRQNIVRHTFVAGPETGGLEDVAHADAQPNTLLPPTIQQASNRFSSSDVIADVPTFRIVQHLKLGSSSTDAPDPLL